MLSACLIKKEISELCYVLALTLLPTACPACIRQTIP